LAFLISIFSSHLSPTSKTLVAPHSEAAKGIVSLVISGNQDQRLELKKNRS